MSASTTTPENENPILKGARIHAAKITTHLSSATATNPKPTGLQTYTPLPTDILIATFPKAGTTLLQQLTYQVSLATGGAGHPPDRDDVDATGTSFSDICDVVPWLDFVPQMGGHWNVASPRIFKTHARGDQVGSGGQRVIVVMRDAEKFPGSWMDFMFGNRPSELTRTADDAVRRLLFDEAVEEKILGTHPSCAGELGCFAVGRNEADGSVYGPWLRFNKSWLDVARGPNRQNVLILFYEDVVRDLAETADKVAALMGKELTAEARERVVRRCSREYMAGREQFKSVWDNKLFGVSALSSKVLPAERDGFSMLRLREDHALELRQQMGRVFGVSSYLELKKRIRQEFP